MYERTGYDWGSVAWGGDPIPGSPDVIESVAADYKSSAENLARAAENLRRLKSSDETRSDAVAAIMEKAVATAGTLEQVQSRYDTISRSLRGYAPELREAQRMSIEAVTEAGPAVRRRDAAHAANETARWRSVTVDQTVRDSAMEDYYRTKQDYLNAAAQVEGAKAKLQQAITKRDRAAEKAEGDVRAGIGGSPLNDSLGDYLSAAWEAISKAVGAALEWVWDHIDEICLVLDVICLVLALTGVGGPVAAVLQLVSKAAKVASVISKVKQGVTMLGQFMDGMRTGNWAPLIGSAIGLAVGFGVGKVLGKVSSKVGDWASARGLSHKVSVGKQTLGAAKAVKDATYQNGNPRDFVMKSIQNDSPLPSYFKAAPTVDKMLKSGNQFAVEAASSVQGAARLMPGGDYARISPYMNQLNRLSGWQNSTISDSLQPTISSIAKESTQDIIETGSGMVASDVAASHGYDGDDSFMDSMRKIGVLQ